MPPNATPAQTATVAAPSAAPPPTNVTLEPFGKPLAVALADPGMSTLLSYLDFKTHLDTQQHAQALATAHAEEREAAKRTRRGPPPPPEEVPVPSFTFVSSSGDTLPKVRVFAQRLVKEVYDDSLDLYSHANLAGYAFWFVAIDPEYNFEKAATALASTLVERKRKYEADLAKGHKRNYHADYRQIVYGVPGEAKLRGYELVTTPSRFATLVSGRYAQLANVPSAPNCYKIDAFSMQAYQQMCDLHGVCTEQRDVVDDDLNLRLGVPACTIELTMEQADPRELALRVWPWHTHLERCVFANPLTEYDAAGIGLHEASMGADHLLQLERIGVVEQERRTRCILQEIYAFDLAHERFEKQVVLDQSNRAMYLRVYDWAVRNAVDAVGAATVERVHREAADAARADAGATPPVRFLVMAEHLSRLARLQQIPASQRSTFETAAGRMRECEHKHSRLTRVLEEEYATWMRVDNVELPPAMQALFMWADAHNYEINVRAPTIAAGMSPFANTVLRIVVTASSAFQVAGMLGPIFHVVVASWMP